MKRARFKTKRRIIEELTQNIELTSVLVVTQNHDGEIDVMTNSPDFGREVFNKLAKMWIEFNKDKNQKLLKR